LQSVHFTDNNTGWAVGPGGTILKTTNGGTNWNSQASGMGTNWNSQTSGTTDWLLSVHFTDNNTGWAVGSGGTILKTTNGSVTFIRN